MMGLVRLAPLLLTLLLNACAYSIHNVHVSGFEPYTAKAAGKTVIAHAEQMVFLGFTGNTNYLNQAYEQLQEECPRGAIVGIVTEYQTALGLLSWKNHIYLKGLCVDRKSSATASVDDGLELF